MKKYKNHQILTALVVLIAVFCLNVSVNFKALFNKDSRNRHFIQLNNGDISATSKHTYDFNTSSDLTPFWNANTSAPSPYISEGNLVLRIDKIDVLPKYGYKFQGDSLVTVEMSRKNDFTSAAAYGRISTYLHDSSGNHIATLIHTPLGRTSYPYDNSMYGSEDLRETLNTGGYIHIIADGTHKKISSTGYTNTYHIEKFEFNGYTGTLTYTLGNNTGSVTSNSLKGKTLGSMYTLYYVWYAPSRGKYLYTDYIHINQSPVISVKTPTQNGMFCETDTAFIPQISVSDTGNDTLTCKYYIDSETTARDTKTVTDTITSKTVNFNALNIGALAEGNHSIKYEVSDGIAEPVTSIVNFKVDKSAPVLSTVTVSSDISSVTISGSAVDSIAGLDNNPYRYSVGSNVTSWSNKTSYTQNNLIPNTQYKVIFEARDKINHIASKSQYIYTKATVPTLVVNNESSYTLDVSATDSNPASTQYLISINNGAKYVTPEGYLTASPIWVTLSNKKIVIKGLNPNTTYSFKAKARNAVNVETAESPSVSGTTLIKPPDAPSNLVATATDNQITVSWDAVQGAAGYEIQADDNIVDVGTSTTFTHTSLSPGTPHTYQVRARNAGGPGNWSTQITKSTLPVSPNVPSNLKAVPQSTSITVTWDSVPGATGYDIEADGILVNNGPSTSYVHGSLSPGTHHTYRVRSINPGGKSEWSVPVSATTTLESSPVPANLSATPARNEIILTWDAVDGASGYEIEVDGVIVDNNNNTSYTHKNLSPGSKHNYRVRSKKGSFISDWSAMVTVETLTDVFGTPTGLKAEANDTSITLSWNQVGFATGYDVEVDGEIFDAGSETNILIAGLEPGSTHVYRVRAKNNTETSDWSEPLQVTTFDLPTPIIIDAVATETAIQVLWDSTTSAALVYDLEVDGTIITEIEEKTYTCEGLTHGTQHVFRVRSRDSERVSNWSIPHKVSTLICISDAPSGLFALMKNTSAIIAWQPVNGAVSYDINVDGTLVENIEGTRYVHTGLLPGSRHTYMVRANYTDHESEWSEEVSVLTIPERSAIPTNLTASSSTSRILVSWDHVTGATGYEIEVDGVVIDNGSGTSYLHNGAAPDTNHYYRVRSKNAAGYSSWSDLIDARTKSSNMTYTVDCETGEDFILLFSAADVQNIGRYVFTIAYDPEKLEVTDLCAITSKADMTAGNITGTDIQIVQFTPGSIVFKRTGPVQDYQAWSGAANAVRFKSIAGGQTDVIYSFQ